MKKRLTTCNSSSSPSSSVSSSISSLIESETGTPKLSKRAKKSSPSDDKPHNSTSPASTRRSSIYRGVARFWVLQIEFGLYICNIACCFMRFYRHRWTGRFKAHLWDKSSWNLIQNKKGKQDQIKVDLVKRNSRAFHIVGAYDNEETAAHTYDLSALKYWGPDTILNFPIEMYTKELEEMERMTKKEYLGSLRRLSSGLSRGV